MLAIGDLMLLAIYLLAVNKKMTKKHLFKMFFLWLTYNYVGDNVFKKILILFLIILSVNVVIHADNGLMIQASSYILMEKESKRVLSEKNMNERYLTASIAKIMTAIITIENCDNLEKYVEVGLDTIRQEGSSIYLKEGDKVKIIDLLYGLLPHRRMGA